MIIPIEIRSTRRFRYFWLKSIRGFKKNVHCAKCLVGEYHSDLDPNGIHAGDIVHVNLDLSLAPVHYLCGVSGKWENNLHIAFQPDETAGPLTVESWGVTVSFPEGGVRRIEIQQPIAGIDPAFGTCRNWLFGLQYFEPSGFQAKGGAESVDGLLATAVSA